MLVFEDLHWADDALLDFVAHLLDWASGVPLLVLATARPELLARRSDWGGGKVNSSTILLSPLSEAETQTLLRGLLGRSVLQAEAEHTLLERAGGNPLYAEEFVRMLTDRGDRVALPESVQGIIAARLDSLPGEEKELLQQAAVMGRVFWLGALGSERWRLEERLHSLERKEFVRRERRSSVAGEAEYAFSHALVRDVAYEQIPRSRRADKHRAAADWIESLGRPEDHAEMLAHHHVQALEYARAADVPTPELATKAIHALQEAGDRALALNAYPASIRYYEHALATRHRQPGPAQALRPAALPWGRRKPGQATRRRRSSRSVRPPTSPSGSGCASSSPAPRSATAAGSSGRSRGAIPSIVPLLERALAALGEEDSTLRVRLLTRLAGGPLRDAGYPARAEEVGEPGGGSRWPAASATRRHWPMRSPATARPAIRPSSRREQVTGGHRAGATWPRRRVTSERGADGQEHRADGPDSNSPTWRVRRPTLATMAKLAKRASTAVAGLVRGGVRSALWRCSRAGSPRRRL